MSTDGPSVALAPPVSLWKKDIRKDDLKAFFGALANTLLYAGLGNVEEAIAAGTEALGAIGLESGSAGEAAWRLIRRALAQAVAELVEEARDEGRLSATEEPAGFDGRIDKKLLAIDVHIDRRFFDDPKRLPLLDALEAPFKFWLHAFGMNQPEAKLVAKRLPSYFVSALHEEWIHKPGDYAKIKDAVDSPFTQADEREQAWRRYGAGLEKAIHEPLFDESFGLVHVYVPLRAFYEAETAPGRDERRKIVRTVVDLERELSAWIDKGDKDDALRVICGGPGAGKSSFAKMFAARRWATGPHVLLVPLYMVDPKQDIHDLIGDFAVHVKGLRDHPLDVRTGEQRLIVMFDGLDELAMQGRSGAELAREFLHAVDRYLSRCNAERLRLQVIAGGRDVVVQEAKGLLRRPKQVLTLLPYYLPSKTRAEQMLRGIEYQDPEALLNEDQRHSWWQCYGAAKGGACEQLPDVLKREDLDEITAQPLLNYLVALSYTRGFDFSKEVNRNEIYCDLIQRVHERTYVKGKQHPSTGGMEIAHFLEALEAIGVATWHGNGRTATVQEIEKQCGDRLQYLLPEYEKTSSRVMGLLAAFYFRGRGSREDGQPTFEFTHKSFGEYLTARRIVRCLRDMLEEKEEREKKRREWNRKEALRDWAKLCGPTAMDQDLFKFIMDEVRLSDVEEAEPWHLMIANLIENLLVNGMPMELLHPRPDYHEEVRMAQNAEAALLACLYACACRTEKPSRIEWPDRTSAGAWIGRLQATFGVVDTLAGRSLGRLDLSRCFFFLQSLVGTNLAHTNLQGANLIGANLRNAHLIDADLTGTDLRDAHLIDADLTGADLTGANLIGANLQRANLRRAYLRRTILTGTDLTGADLTGADLRNARLIDADLTGADLTGANLIGADLHGADLAAAILTDACMPNGWKKQVRKRSG